MDQENEDDHPVLDIKLEGDPVHFGKQFHHDQEVARRITAEEQKEAERKAQIAPIDAELARMAREDFDEVKRGNDEFTSEENKEALRKRIVHDSQPLLDLVRAKAARPGVGSIKRAASIPPSGNPILLDNPQEEVSHRQGLSGLLGSVRRRIGSAKQSLDSKLDQNGECVEWTKAGKTYSTISRIYSEVKGESPVPSQYIRDIVLSSYMKEIFEGNYLGAPAESEIKKRSHFGGSTVKMEFKSDQITSIRLEEGQALRAIGETILGQEVYKMIHADSNPNRPFDWQDAVERDSLHSIEYHFRDIIFSLEGNPSLQIRFNKYGTLPSLAQSITILYEYQPLTNEFVSTGESQLSEEGEPKVLSIEQFSEYFKSSFKAVA